MNEKKYVIGNWKCHKKYDEARKWLDQFAKDYVPTEGVEVVIAPTFLILEKVSEYVQSLGLKNFSLAAQDISPYPCGSYTGAIAADLMKDLVDYVIVGHSERRRYFQETSHNVSNKVSEAVDANLIPVVCVDQSYAISQLTALNDVDNNSVIIAYCPVDALNFRIPQPPEKVQEGVEFVGQVRPKWPVIYGGALHPDNADDYAGIQGIAGLFVGSASLEVKSFHAIVSALCQKA